jgi:hypothetical protein
MATTITHAMPNTRSSLCGRLVRETAVTRNPSPLQKGDWEPAVTEREAVLHHSVDVEEPLTFRDVAKERSKKRGDKSTSDPDRDGPEEVAPLANVRKLIHHDLVQQLADTRASLWLVAEELIKSRIHLAVERHS